MTTAITHRSVLVTATLGLALAVMLSAQVQAAERMVLAEYFTSVL